MNLNRVTEKIGIFKNSKIVLYILIILMMMMNRRIQEIMDKLFNEINDEKSNGSEDFTKWSVFQPNIVSFFQSFTDTRKYVNGGGG